MLYLDKLLSQLAYPLGLAIGLALLALLLMLRGWRRGAAALLSIGILWLFLWSMPVVSDRLRASLEERVKPEPIALIPQADAVVVLGGGIRGATPRRPDPDLGQAADRVWHAARLYHAGKAPLIIVSGGSLPWLGERQPEADAMLAFLVDLGVPAHAILLEGRSMNTRENALYTAELLAREGHERVLLVTSALHMPRAWRPFARSG